MVPAADPAMQTAIGFKIAFVMVFILLIVGISVLVINPQMNEKPVLPADKKCRFSMRSVS